MKTEWYLRVYNLPTINPIGGSFRAEADGPGRNIIETQLNINGK